ncbi:MAG: hypothetical protein ACRDRS_11040 [Pseudonocardiaceae bacterium]
MAGKSLPRSWDDGAVLVVDAIIKLADRYGKRFADAEAVRQRCKDAYDRAKSAPQADSTPGSGTPVPGIDATAAPVEAAPRRAANDGPEPAKPGPEPSSVRWWRARYAVSAVAVFAVLTVVVALILLPHRDASNCIDRSNIVPWGTSEIHVCAADGQGNYFTQTTTKTTNKTAGYCVRWRIVWENHPDTPTPLACLQKDVKYSNNRLKGVTGVQDAFFEEIPQPTGMHPTSP